MFILSLAIELFAGTPIDFTQPNIRFSEIFTKGDGNPGLPQFIQEMITFLVGVAGILAIVMLLYSGFKRITSAGSSESVQEAGEIMWSALIGLFIALGSVFFLNTINPSLTTLHPLDFKNLTIQDSKNAKGVKVEIVNDGRASGSGRAPGARGGGVGNRGARIRTLAEIEGGSLFGEVTFFAGKSDQEGIDAVAANDKNGLFFVDDKRNPRIPANFWRNDPNSPNNFADLNEEAFYFAVWTNDRVPTGTRFVITNKKNGRRAIAILIDKGPSRSNTVLDGSRGLNRYLDFRDGEYEVTIVRAPDQNVMPGPLP